jgi:hypothetical protein
MGVWKPFEMNAEEVLAGKREEAGDAKDVFSGKNLSKLTKEFGSNIVDMKGLEKSCSIRMLKCPPKDVDRDSGGEDEDEDDDDEESKESDEGSDDSGSSSSEDKPVASPLASKKKLDVEPTRRRIPAKVRPKGELQKLIVALCIVWLHNNKYTPCCGPHIWEQDTRDTYLVLRVSLFISGDQNDDLTPRKSKDLDPLRPEDLWTLMERYKEVLSTTVKSFVVFTINDIGWMSYALFVTKLHHRSLNKKTKP